MNRPYLSAELRRAEAVATVIELAASHDPAVLTTGQIAAAMGVSQGALFRHFPDKLAIWTAVLEWTCGELNHRFDTLSEGPPLARLEAGQQRPGEAFAVSQQFSIGPAPAGGGKAGLATAITHGQRLGRLPSPFH